MTRISWQPGFLSVNEIYSFLTESNLVCPFIVAHYVGLVPEHEPNSILRFGSAEAVFCGTIEQWRSVAGEGHIISIMLHGHAKKPSECLARAEDPAFYKGFANKQDPLSLWEMDVNDNFENTLVLPFGTYRLPGLGITVSSC